MPETITPPNGQTGNDAIPAPAPEPDFDDGLVHDHSWACGERGAPAR